MSGTIPASALKPGAVVPLPAKQGGRKINQTVSKVFPGTPEPGRFTVRFKTGIQREFGGAEAVEIVSFPTTV